MSTKKKRINTQPKRNAINDSGVVENDKEDVNIKNDVEIQKYNLDLVNTWIANMDTKVSISCGIFSTVIPIIVFVSENYFNNLDLAGIKRVCCLNAFWRCAITASVCFVASIIIHFCAIIPSLFGKKKIIDDKPEYSIFYENIRKFKNVEEYKSAVSKANKDDFISDLISEIYFNSVICSKKVHRFSWAVRIGIASLIMTIVSIVLYYFAYV